MSRIVWHDENEMRYGYGLYRGVFYPRNGPGVPWNGLSSVETTGEDLGTRYSYIDGVKRSTVTRRSELTGTIESFSYPESFYESVLSPQIPSTFGFCYRTKTNTEDLLNLIYGVRLDPAGKTSKYEEVEGYSWGFSTRPRAIFGSSPSAHFVIDMDQAYPETVADLEDTLYGSDTKEPTLPEPELLLAIFEQNALLKIVDNGDGTWTADGPPEVLTMLDATTFEITSPSVTLHDDVSYSVYSY